MNIPATHAAMKMDESFELRPDLSAALKILLTSLVFWTFKLD